MRNRMKRSNCLPALALIAVSACQTPDDYPSLARRPGELATPAPAPSAAPAPVGDPALAPRLAALAAESQAAHARFAAATPPARTAIAAARGSAVGSEAWARASTALVALESARGQTAGVLADLDSLYIAGQTEGREVSAVAPVRAEVEALLADEDKVLSALQGQLPG